MRAPVPRLAILLAVLTLGGAGCKKQAAQPRRKPYAPQPCATVFPKAPPTIVRVTVTVESTRPKDQQYDYLGEVQHWLDREVLGTYGDGFVRGPTAVCVLAQDVALPTLELKFVETVSHAFGPEPEKVAADVDATLTVRDAAGKLVLTLPLIPQRPDALWQSREASIYGGVISMQLVGDAFDVVEPATAVALGDGSQLGALALETVGYGATHDSTPLAALLDGRGDELDSAGRAARAVDRRKFADAAALGAAAVPALMELIDGPWVHHAPDDQLRAAVAALASIPGPEADEALNELATASPYARGRVAELVLAARPRGDAGVP